MSGRLRCVLGDSIPEDHVVGVDCQAAFRGSVSVGVSGGEVVGDFMGGQRCDAFGEIVDVDDVAGVEAALDGGDADEEEALAAFEGVGGSGVDEDAALGGAVEYPSFAIAESAFG